MDDSLSGLRVAERRQETFHPVQAALSGSLVHEGIGDKASLIAGASPEFPQCRYVRPIGFHVASLPACYECPVTCRAEAFNPPTTAPPEAVTGSARPEMWPVGA